MADNPRVRPSLTPAPFALAEVNLADAMSTIVTATDVPESRKKAWLTALRSLSSAIGRPPQSLPCRLSALRHHVDRINPAALGWSEKTLANHKSNAKAALQYVMKVTEVPIHGAPNSDAWAILLEAVADIQSRRLLSPLARYCSARDVTPPAVSEAEVEAYVEYREQATFRDVSVAYQRSLVRAWNRCVERVPGWPGHTIALPALRPKTPGPNWEDFPEGLRLDIEAHLQSLTVPHRASNGKRWRGVKDSTLQTRREELVAFARRAVSAGTAINSLTSLAALLAPEVVQRTFEAYLPSDGSPASVYVIDLGGKLLSIARVIGAPPFSIARLDDIRARLEDDRGPALTEKNLAVIRQVVSTDVWRKVIQLPESLMRQATRILNRQPRKALSFATIALQIEMSIRFEQ